jgi:hypothetical protein
MAPHDLGLGGIDGQALLARASVAACALGASGGERF